MSIMAPSTLIRCRFRCLHRAVNRRSPTSWPLIQFGPRFGYDVDRKDYFAETTISLDFAALDDPVGALIGVGPMRDYRDDEP